MRVFGPGMFWISSAQFSPQLRIQVFPETRQVGSHLHGSMIRREQLHHDRHRTASYCELLVQSKEILQPRRDRRRKSLLVLNSYATPTRKLKVRRRQLLKKTHIDLRLQSKKQPTVRSCLAGVR